MSKGVKYFNENNGYTLTECYEEWHDDRYLKQCLYNLQEKYDCGSITQEEWQKIENKFKEVM